MANSDTPSYAAELEVLSKDEVCRRHFCLKILVEVFERYKQLVFF